MRYVIINDVAGFKGGDTLVLQKTENPDILYHADSCKRIPKRMCMAIMNYNDFKEITNDHIHKVRMILGNHGVCKMDCDDCVFKRSNRTYGTKSCMEHNGGFDYQTSLKDNKFQSIHWAKVQMCKDFLMMYREKKRESNPDKVVRPDNVGTRKMIVKRFPVEAGEYLIKNAKFRIGDVVDVWHEGDDYYVDGCGVLFGRSMLEPVMTANKFKHITLEHLQAIIQIIKDGHCSNVKCRSCPFTPDNRNYEHYTSCFDFKNYQYDTCGSILACAIMAKDFIEMIKDEMPELTPDIEAKYKTVNVKEATEILNKINDINQGEKLPTSRTMKIEGVPANLLPDLLDLSNGDVYEMFEIDDKTMQFEKDGITIQLSKDFCKEVEPPAATHIKVEVEFKDPKEGPSTLGIYTALKVLKRYCMERQQCIDCPLSKLCNGNGPGALYEAVLKVKAKTKFAELPDLPELQKSYVNQKRNQFNNF